jgi:predicted DNA-binding protein
MNCYILYIYTHSLIKERNIALSISDKNDRLTIIIPKELKEQIKDLADKEKRSMGNYISHILEEHVKNQELNEHANNLFMETKLPYNISLSEDDIEEVTNLIFKKVESRLSRMKNTSDK